MLDSVISSLGLKYGSILGGFLGALVSLKFIEDLSFTSRATTVFAGTAVSAYLSPTLIIWLEMSSKLEGGIAFLCGLFGMSFTGAVIKAMPDLLTALKEKFLK